MAVSKMNKKIQIIKLVNSTDEEGFSKEIEELVVKVRAYQEGRHGSEKWSNLASFSEATDLFTFRKIPNIKIDESMYVVLDSVRYDILSVEGIHGRGMYIEVLAKRNIPSDGKS